MLSIAPMMEYTDNSFRDMARTVTKRTRLYTEMVVSGTLWFNEARIDEALRFGAEQHPVALQVGGSDPLLLAHAAALGALYGYDEVNLNCGCPSERVASAGCFGAAMMLRPELVRECCEAMIEAVRLVGKADACAVTVKCRLGADDMDSYEEYRSFADQVAAAGVRHLIVHARKCWLAGLNPKDNRNVPPLRPEWVLRLAAEERAAPSGMRISLNGHVRTLREAAHLLRLQPAPEKSPSELEAAREAEGPNGAATAPAAAAAAAPASDAGAGAPGVTSAAPGPFSAGLVRPPAVKAVKRPSSDGDSPALGPQRKRSKQTRFDKLVSGTATRLYDGPVLWAPPLEAPPPPPASSLVAGGASLPCTDRSPLLDSVMVGRGAYDLWRFADADRAVFGEANPPLTRGQAIRRYLSEHVPREEQAILDSATHLGRSLMRWSRVRTEASKPVLLLLRGMRDGNKCRAAITQGVTVERRKIRAWVKREMGKDKAAAAAVAAEAAAEAAAADGAVSEQPQPDGAATRPMPASLSDAVEAAKASFARRAVTPDAAVVAELRALMAQVRPLAEVVEDGLALAPEGALDELPPSDPAAPWWDPVDIL
ncbi:hypothetical protein FNF29_00838 [Cafeteria roenbergensis]|uniref:DUS-like FMN-binding domain-containing protein n=1 Tax=Cafeteria roenbergensis TaxID=33653 RepID=A0A5A8CWE9_CAFRO|nr:hypothetical protein FNF29_00838 [Cafeteria roenbergensis]|eukprot:KAA0156727.1 hypothetical protein FNF29_00838 [Cafeteria roenbergensis]